MIGRRVELRPVHTDRAYLQSLFTDPLIAYSSTLIGGKPGTPRHDYLVWSQGDASLAQFIVAHRATGRPVGWVGAFRADLWSGTCIVTMAFERGPELRAWPLEGAVVFLRYLASEFRIRKVFFEQPGYLPDNLEAALVRHGGRVEVTRPGAVWALGETWDHMTIGFDLTCLTAAKPVGCGAVPPTSVVSHHTLVGRRSILRPIADHDRPALWRIFNSSTGLRFRGRGVPQRPGAFDDFLWRGIFVQFAVASRADPDTLRGIQVAYAHDPVARTVRMATYFDTETTPSYFLLDSSALFLDFLFDSFPLERVYFEVLSSGNAPRRVPTGLAQLDHVGSQLAPEEADGTAGAAHIYVLTRDGWATSSVVARPPAGGSIN